MSKKTLVAWRGFIKGQSIYSAECHHRLEPWVFRRRSKSCSLTASNTFNSRDFSTFTQFERQWKTVNRVTDRDESSYVVMSYNVLAQHHVDSQPFLYHDHDSESLRWTHRFELLKSEIDSISPDILCLQEVQKSHLAEIRSHFAARGYETSLYKKRTGLQVDGCAIFYKSGLFNLIENHYVDYFQPDIKVLNRCNVAIIAKLALKSKPEAQFVVSTTHLLFNPRRHDIRLAQVQILLAELDRIARDDIEPKQNIPIVLTGDFNMQQNSEVFRLIIGEAVRPQLLFKRMNFLTESSNLLPLEMGISDDCQHLDVAAHSNRYRTALQTSAQLQKRESHPSVQKRSYNSEEVQKSRLRFDTGTLTHHLNLLPTICASRPFRMDLEHASTYHNRWIMVDYIFFSEAMRSKQMTAKLKLLENYELPTIAECTTDGPIPNVRHGSDHYSLAARFSIH